MLDPDAYTSDLGRRIRAQARDIGIAVCCLTSYYSDFVTPAKRAGQIAGLEHVVEMAAELDCPLVRAMGGPTGGPEKDPAVVRFAHDRRATSRGRPRRPARSEAGH